MPQTINTNMFSLNAQRNLNKSQGAMGMAIQRLSSGLRINSAKDDAAGMAVAEGMTSKIRGLDVASRNANDGISLAQTAEAALGEITNNLQRIRELAVQSANGTLGNEERGYLQTEVNELTSEITRIIKDTSFNGKELFAGNTSVNIQVGADKGDQIALNTLDLTTLDAFETDAERSAADDAGLLIGDLQTTYDDAKTAQTTAQTAANTAQTTYDDAPTAANLTALNTAITTRDDADTAATEAFDALTAGQAAAIVTSVDISTADKAANAIATDSSVTKDIHSVINARSKMGAVQNRFESVISNINSYKEGLQAARSRITDTDYAAETAELARSQVLQQAGVAMVAQANQIPSGVLRLLG